MPFEIKPFLNLALSLQNLRLSTPILHNIATLTSKTDHQGASGGFLSKGILHSRLSRHYLRLCRVSGELDRLDLKKAAPDSHRNFSLEDFVFSGIDFSRYREINEKDFSLFQPEALGDFSEEFFKKNFGLYRSEVQSVIEGSYEKKVGQTGMVKYKLTRENPMILSIMRTLEISLENSPLFTIEEIQKEAEKLPGISGKNLSEMDELYRQLVFCLNGVSVTHIDGMVTKLFVSHEGKLSGVFRPGNKPWTRVLIPNLTNN